MHAFYVSELIAFSINALLILLISSWCLHDRRCIFCSGLLSSMCNILHTLLDDIVTLYIWTGAAILMVVLVVVVMVAVTMGYNRYRARKGMYLWLTQCMYRVVVGTSDTATSHANTGGIDDTVSPNTAGDYANNNVSC